MGISRGYVCKTTQVVDFCSCAPIKKASSENMLVGQPHPLNKEKKIRELAG